MLDKVLKLCGAYVQPEGEGKFMIFRSLEETPALPITTPSTKTATLRTMGSGRLANRVPDT